LVIEKISKVSRSDMGDAEQLIPADHPQRASRQHLLASVKLCVSVGRRLNSGVRHASRNKRIKSGVAKLRKLSAELNDTINGRSNISFNRSAS
jgi:hypothetical protein